MIKTKKPLLESQNRENIAKPAEKMPMVKALLEVFEGRIEGFKISCEACGNQYEVRVIKGGQAYTDFGIICCVFCGRQIKLY